jgi:uncharacterized membrane protein
MVTLLQSGGMSGATGSAGAVRVLLVVGLLIIVVLAFGLFVLHFRKRLLSDDGADGGSGLMLEQLRAMVRRGEMSEQEFELMRRRMVEKLSGRSAAGLSASTGRAAGPIKGPDSPENGAGRERGEARRSAPGLDLTGERLPNPEGGE